MREKALMTVLLPHCLEARRPVHTYHLELHREYWRLLGNVVCLFSVYLPLGEPELMVRIADTACR